MSFLRLPLAGKLKKRQNKPEMLKSAYHEVRNNGTSVYKAARMYGVPESTLRDRFLGLQPVPDETPNLPNQGPAPTFTKDEELQLVKHVTYMASIGYGYSRSEFLTLATDFAISLGKKKEGDPAFAPSWYSGFKDRNPEIGLSRAQKLSFERAKCTSEKVLDNYFAELSSVMKDKGLLDKPENIWNLDETGIVMEHNPSKVICLKGYTPQAITSSRGKTVTILGCGSAAGTRVPPYYIFPGRRWNDELLNGACPGASGEMSDSGWSNSTILLQYFRTHFIKFVPLNGDPVLVLFDGHRSHMNLTLIRWAEDHNVIFFVLPPHTSHVTQPLDVGCFGPLKNSYNSECQVYLRNNPGMRITRYNVAAISGKAYNKGLSPENLISSFKKTGIYPLERDTINKIKTAPSIIYQEKENEPETETKTNFLETKKITAVKEVKKKRKMPPSITGNIMEPEKKSLLKEVQTDEPKKLKKSSKVIKEESCETKKSANLKRKNSGSPKPSTSGTNLDNRPGFIVDSEDNDGSECDGIEDTEETEVCCVCNRFSPRDLNLAYTLEIVTWGQCSACGHWTHLKFCTEVKCLRRASIFLCPHCKHT